MRYTGTMSATQGEVCTLSGVTVSQLLGTSLGGAIPSNTLSVNQMFQLASSAERLSLDGHEIKWRPGQSSHKARPSSTGAVATSTGSAINIGVHGVSRSTGTPEALTDSAEAIIIAWRGLAAAAPLVVETHVGLEWMPNATQGFQAPMHIDIGPSDTFSTVLRSLDRLHSGWEGVSAPLKRSATSAIAGMAQAGANYYLRRGPGRLQ
jgi:hypothetical protein